MRNVTLTLEDEVLGWAKIYAAEHDTSVSRFLSDLLRERMDHEQNYTQAMKRDLSRKAVILRSESTSEHRYPSRDELHERLQSRRR